MFRAGSLFVSWLCACFGAAEGFAQILRPADIVMNEAAGRGGLLIVTVRSGSGEEWPVVLDTGCAKTGFDRSLEPKLGQSVGSQRFWNFGVSHEGLLYAVPRMYLGGALLQMSSPNVGTYDCRGISAFAGLPIMGLLGMDVLSHYCVQLDFAARRVRFLDDEEAGKQDWGEAFPLMDAGDGCFYIEQNLFGGSGVGSLIDTGSLHDGWLRPEFYATWTSLAEQPVDGECRFPGGVLGSERYPELDLERLDALSVASQESHTKYNGIGIQFLSLHLVTLDFPRKTMYLKRTREESGHTSAEMFIWRLKEKGHLPGWPEDEEMASRHAILHFDYPDSATLAAHKTGDAWCYNYSIVRRSERSPWKLQKAWRTDATGKTNEELSVLSRPRAE